MAIIVILIYLVTYNLIRYKYRCGFLYLFEVLKLIDVCIRFDFGKTPCGAGIGITLKNQSG
jgi:hypothetical protein